MSDPDCCPVCGTFWTYHNEADCAMAVHNENTQLRARAEQAEKALADLRVLAGRLATDSTEVRVLAELATMGATLAQAEERVAALEAQVRAFEEADRIASEAFDAETVSTLTPEQEQDAARVRTILTETAEKHVLARRVAALEAALDEAIQVIGDQQAMPDDGPIDRLRAVREGR